MKLKDQYYELIQLRKRKEASETLKSAGMNKQMISNVFSKIENNRLITLENKFKENEQSFTVRYDILISELKASLNKMIGRATWYFKIDETTEEHTTEYFEGITRNNLHYYTISLRYGNKTFALAKIGPVDHDIFLELYSEKAKNEVNLLNQDFSLNLNSIVEYQLDHTKKMPILCVDELEEGLWNAIKQSKVQKVMGDMNSNIDKMKKMENEYLKIEKLVYVQKQEIKELED